MKTIFRFAQLSILALAFASCDKVKDPIVKKDIAVGTNFITKTNDAKAGFRKVFLEDYTGHTCGNCPAAAVVAENLYKQYKDTVVVIAVHAGWFARTNSTYPTSHTTTVGNDWDGAAGFNISAVGNPNGMVNRKAYPGFSLIQKETAWPACVALAKKDDFITKLNLTSNYDPAKRALNVDAKITFMKAYANEVKLNLVLMEDSVIGRQKDYSIAPLPDLVEGYVFMHMLRDAVNGSWGDVVKTGASSVNDTARVSYKNFALNSKFNDKQIYLVGIVYDGTTREVIQVEKVKIR